MEKFGLPRENNEEGISNSTLGKGALLAGALLAAGVAYENRNDGVLEAEQSTVQTQITENPVPLEARERIPLQAFYAVDEYKSIIGDTWSIRSIPDSDSEQDRMQAAIAHKHGVSVHDFMQAFEWKLRDAGLQGSDSE